MVYLPKIYHTNQPNVGKYTMHGSYGKSNDLWVTLGIQSPKLRMGAWNLNTLRFGGDWIPQSSSDKVSQDP